MGKKQDFMIGDYVKCSPSNLPIKIVAVHQKKVAYHACTDKLSWVRTWQIQGVAISFDFLERNGFEKVQNLYVLKCSNSVYPSFIFVEYNIANGAIFLNDAMIPKPVRFIHELQHIFNVCGIDKEVVL